MVLIAGLDGRLLTLLSLWLGSIVARQTFQNNTNFKFRSSLSRFVLFLVDSGFLFVNNGKPVKESVFESSHLLDKMVNF